MEAKNEEARSEEAPPAREEEDKSKPRVVDRRRFRAGEEEGEAAPGDGRDEADGDEDGGSRYPTFVQELQRKAAAAEEKVAKAEEKLREHIERVNRESAEFRGRQERELERRTLKTRKQVVSGFLGIADDIARASAAAGESLAGGEPGREALESLLQGVRMIQGRFFQELASLGVEPFAAKGVPFDPERHEAIRTEEVTDPALDGMVIEEAAPGYMLGDSILRPSKVCVGRLARAEGASEGEAAPAGGAEDAQETAGEAPADEGGESAPQPEKGVR
ncbi:MAG: nucleotide exchange factor GrpE [bacterium]